MYTHGAYHVNTYPRVRDYIIEKIDFACPAETIMLRRVGRIR